MQLQLETSRNTYYRPSSVRVVLYSMPRPLEGVLETFQPFNRLPTILDPLVRPMEFEAQPGNNNHDQDVRDQTG